MAIGRPAFWRILTLTGTLTGAVSGALLCWSWGSTVAALPLTPLLLVGGAGLLVAFAASLPLTDNGVPVLRHAAAIILMLLLWTSALAADDVADAVASWARTSQAVTTTLNGCRVDGTSTSDSGSVRVETSCVYHWMFDGRERSERRGSRSAGQDGGHQQMWMDPQTGEISDHSGLPLVFAAALFALLTAAIAVTAGWRWLRREFKKLRTEPDRTD
ncbi:hypothetical protein [Kitasatospora sp. NPDC056181]|uniref:hypothetical protein n=1 Tax=Kitasatospora sp. NPDC056181 TaxID=3345737 RepID=UPI0035D5AA21